MAYDIRNVKNITDLISYFSQNLGWDISIDDFDDIEDISYDFDAEDVGLKEDSFAKISSLRQLQPLVDGQKWGIFCVEFDSNRFEVSALRKILSGLIPRRRNSVDHAVWCQQDLLFICNWGNDNNRTIGVAHFEDKEKGLPQIKMISCAPALEDFTQIKVFEDRLSKLAWPRNTSNIEEWRKAWSSAFTTAYRQTIQDSSTLTIQLAAEAQNIRNRILDVLEVESRNGYVHLLYKKFRDTLIHDMTEQQFADMYAQTVVYGLFSARCMDLTQDDFSAEEAVDCIPNTNPFLKSLMQECLGSQNNSRLSFDELEIGNVVELLMHTKTDELIADFNRQTGGGREDPVIHFYENFLTAYDKMQKIQRGVYYTPQPVVSFIVRAIDSIIKNEFGFEQGLASTDTKRIKVTRRSKRKVDGYHTLIEDTEEVPAIQVLDPATGTGTFIRQTILQIYENFKENNKRLSKIELKKAWNEYVPKHLLPRINAFELMMAPYAVAHMKLAMVLKDTGYDFSSDRRLNLYLTNTLEEPGNSSPQMTLWDDPLAIESVYANAVKVNDGINIVLGNPPYSSESTNRNDWIDSLIEDYKKEPGTNERLNERNYKAINDDYARFIRACSEYVLKNECGILAFINNHAFLDNPTFRGMRWLLLQQFDEIYVLDLHGNIMRKETAENGEKDQNVFDIQQGVSINIFINNKKKHNDIAKVYRCDVLGSREKKYEFLTNKSLSEIQWEEVRLSKPQYMFINRDASGSTQYEKGFAVNELMEVSSACVVTSRDNFVTDTNREELVKRIQLFSDLSKSDDEINSILFDGKLDLSNNSLWDMHKARIQCSEINVPDYIYRFQYRPFDERFIFYFPPVLDRGREKVMKHMISGENVALIISRQAITDNWSHVQITKNIADNRVQYSNKGLGVECPLYLYSEQFGEKKRRANLNNSILCRIAEGLDMDYVEFRATNTDQSKTFSAQDLFDYIYAVLSSSKYRNEYKQFLKYNYPRVPFPKNPDIFIKMCELGSCLRKLHTESENMSVQNNSYYGSYCPTILKPKHTNSRIELNSSGDYIDGVPSEVWEFYYGGYQPLQKWLKDRKGKSISEQDLTHYLKMITIIKQSISIIEEIDDIIEL